MKVKFDESGNLVISPQNNTEAFALKAWDKETTLDTNSPESKLAIIYSKPKPSKKGKKLNGRISPKKDIKS